MGLIIGVYKGDNSWQLPLELGENVTIGTSKNDVLTISDSELRDAHFSFTAKKGVFKLTSKEGVFSNGAEIKNANLSVGDVFACGNVSVYICPKQDDYERSVNLSTAGEFILGRSKRQTIT